MYTVICLFTVTSWPFVNSSTGVGTLEQFSFLFSLRVTGTRTLLSHE
jgi:hypothetical protein